MLKSFSIRTKLTILVVISLLAVLIATGAGLYYVNQISENLTRDLYEAGLGSGMQQVIAANEASKAAMERTVAIIDIAVITVIILLAVLITRSITGPIKKTVLMLQEMMRGRLGRRLSLGRKDEIGVMGDTLDHYAEHLQKNVISMMERISEGDLDIEIDAADPEDEVSPVMKAIVRTLKSLVGEAKMLAEAAVEGRLETRGDAEKFQGGYKEIISGINDTLDAISRPLDVAKDFITGLAAGTQMEMIPKTDRYKGYYGDLIENLNGVLEALLDMLSEVGGLTEAATNGKLSYRADVSKLNGGYKSLVQGINDTLDAVIGPLRMAADYIDRIGEGEIPEKIANEYLGDFNDIKDSINSCIDGLDGLAEARDVLGVMQHNDFTRKVLGEHQGVYAEIAESVNLVSERINAITHTLQRVAEGDLGQLSELEEIGKRSENDTLMPAVITMMETIESLIGETVMLSAAAVEGKLETRGDSSKFRGEYTRVVEGINKTLDAVIAPVNEALKVLQEMERGNLHQTMEGDYRGDHAAIKTAMNGTIQSLKSYVEEISGALTEISRGNLNISITADYKGDFVEIKDSLNNIIGSLNQVMGDISEAADQVAAGSKQVSDGSQTLSQGSTEQASSVQELNASITEIATQTRQNAVNANQASDLAREARYRPVRK